MMSCEGALDCSIFVDFSGTREDFLQLLLTITGGHRDSSLVLGSVADLSTVSNDESDSSRIDDPVEGFLFYRYKVEIEPLRGAGRSEYIIFISHLLEALWTAGCRAVAACDFEDELPRSGGYKHRYQEPS